MEVRSDLLTVDDSHFYAYGAKTPHANFQDIEDLVEAAERLGAKHLWVCAGTAVSRLAQGAFSENGSAECGWNVAGIGKDNPSYLSVRRQNARHEDHIEIGFPEWSRWPWKPVSDHPLKLMKTIACIEDALGITIGYTPAWTALELFKRLNANRWNWLEPMTLNIQEKGFDYASDVARELHWPPKGREVAVSPDATHYVYIDGNSAYNAAETGLNVGQGNPQWVTSGVLYDGRRPGIWRVRYKVGPNRWNGHNLPDLAERRWMTTDLIEQARRVGFEIFIEDGWIWMEYHQTLRSFAELLWNTRVLWRNKEPGPVQEAVHDSVRTMLKALHGKLAREDNAPRFRRRDIWAMVVARSVAMVIYRIEKIYKQFGILPVRIKADEFKYAVSDPHLLDSILDRDKLGGFKLVRVEEICPDN